MFECEQSKNPHMLKGDMCSYQLTSQRVGNTRLRVSVFSMMCSDVNSLQFVVRLSLTLRNIFLLNLLSCIHSIAIVKVRS